MASYGQSVTVGYSAWNTNTGAYVTGDASNQTIYLNKDGTIAAATNSPSEDSSTNAPGQYSIVLTTAEAQHNVVKVMGKSSTSNVIIIPTAISFEQLPTALTGAGNVKTDALAINGIATTSVTAVNANMGTTQPTNFSGTGSTAYIKSDTEQLNAQTVTAAAGVTFPSSVASPTNITGGTITTVTNLTNAPMNGDLTATMKTSVTTAATAATPTIAGYTGNTPQTGDSYARLGAPAGASVSADIAAVNAKTTNLPAAPASTTNITAGTITTVTNLTNAPTNGDLTAAMKASVTTAATASTPTAAAVTGNVGGNVIGSVGSVIAAVEVGSYVTNEDPATLVLGATASSWNVSGTIGNKINSAGSASDPWSTALPGSYTAGEAGYIIGHNIDAAVSSRSTYAGGAVASVTAPVTVGTNDDKTGYTLTSAYDAAKTASQFDAATTPILLTPGTGTGEVDLSSGVLTASLSGDLTPTMKTSVTTACTASTPTAAAVTGDVGGNVDGSVASVTAPVTVGIVNATATNFKKNTALAGFMFLMTDSTTHSPATGLTVTGTVSLDGGTFTGLTNAISEIANGWYTINLAAADLNGNNVALRFIASSADDRDIYLTTTP